MPLLALIADNDPPSAELARYLLEADGLDVVCAADGEAALSLAAALRPAVIVVDLDLSVLDGCAVRDRLEADPTLAAIPVIAMSVYEISEFSPDHRPEQFAGYIRKPIDPTAFADQVRAAIARPEPG
jgi:CheY-like chemotaxis protein